MSFYRKYQLLKHNKTHKVKPVTEEEEEEPKGPERTVSVMVQELKQIEENEPEVLPQQDAF